MPRSVGVRPFASRRNPGRRSCGSLAETPASSAASVSFCRPLSWVAVSLEGIRVAALWGSSQDNALRNAAASGAFAAVCPAAAGLIPAETVWFSTFS